MRARGCRLTVALVSVEALVRRPHRRSAERGHSPRHLALVAEEAAVEQLCPGPSWRRARGRAAARLRLATVLVVGRRRCRRLLARVQATQPRRRRALGPAWKGRARWCTLTGCRYSVGGGLGCALLYAERGGMALREVAEVLTPRGLSRERVRQVEVHALANLPPELRAALEEHGERGAPRRRRSEGPRERRPRRVLSVEQVRGIRGRHAAGESRSSLARAHGVTTQTVDAIVHRKTWRHLP